MSDTPESDSAERMAFANEYMVPTEVARKLERERDEAIADRDILRIDAQREAELHDRMLSELEKVYKERDEARKEAEYYRERYEQLIYKERDEARKEAEYYRERYEQLKEGK